MARPYLMMSALSVCLILGACTQGGTSSQAPPVDEPTATQAPAQSESPSTTPTADDGGDMSDDPAVRAAIDDLANRTGSTADQIEVTALAHVTWPDGSLGCPQPGRQYSQALVPGRQLMLTVDGEDFAYHAGRGGTFTYCAEPSTALEEDEGSS